MCLFQWNFDQQLQKGQKKRHFAQKQNEAQFVQKSRKKTVQNLKQSKWQQVQATQQHARQGVRLQVQGNQQWARYGVVNQRSGLQVYKPDYALGLDADTYLLSNANKL